MRKFATPLLLLAMTVVTLGDEKKAKKPQPETAAEKKQQPPPPATLEEAHQQLEKLLPKSELAKIDAMKSEDEMIEYHFGLGMGMRNEWGLWGGGPLAKSMNKLGFHHPDDMSGVILETFWCKRHQKDYRLKERAADCEAYWKVVADPPESAVDPKDGSAVDWSITLGRDDDKKLGWIHVGKSRKTGRWLAYEYDRGVYEPDPALSKRISDSERSAAEGVKSDPFAAKGKPATK